MSTEIYNQNYGRSISSYELLDETRETYGLSRQDAHDAIHAMLSGIIEIDGEETVILDRTPGRPELLTSNSQDVDIDQWITVSDETADAIREALAAVYAEQ
ncbi:hypothetical protein ACIQGT_36305 [Streptomyces sp. NPDC093108]|uniref:hypothetical protein n=1 Tax=Streptomyces sp. NPDC093108 TaxID=3366030 RepID=UPI003807C535